MADHIKTKQGEKGGEIGERESAFSPRSALRRSPERTTILDTRASTSNTTQQQLVSNVNVQSPDYHRFIQEINNVMTTDKNMAVKGKNIVNENIRKISQAIEAMVLRINTLETENRMLKQRPAPLSYSQVATKPIPQDRNLRVTRAAETKKHTVFVQSKDGKSPKEIQKIITTKINPATEKVKIRNIRTTERTVIIEAETKEDIEKIMNNDKLKCDLQMELPKKRNPLVIVYDVDTQMKEEEMLENIYQQNFEEMDKTSFMEGCKVRFKTGPRNRATVHYVVEMTGTIRKLVTQRGRLYIGFSSHNVKDYIVVPRCLKCQDLGHIAKHCRKEEGVCAHCGDSGHNKSDCPKKQQPSVCIPCSTRKKRCTDRKECQTHKMLWERLIAKTDYE